MSEERPRCTPAPARVGKDSGYRTLCKTMSSRAKDMRGVRRGRGLWLAILTKWTPIGGSAPAAGFVFYRTSAKDAGLVLNRCPWCDGRLNQSPINKNE